VISARRTWRRDWVPALGWLLAMSLALWGDELPVRSAVSAQPAAARLSRANIFSQPAAVQTATADASGTAQEMTREQATRMLQVRYGTSAKVVRTDVLEQDGHHVYVFRLLSVNGRIWIVHIDAKSGTEVP
jgi:hypothetical protein